VKENRGEEERGGERVEEAKVVGSRRRIREGGKFE
jgi:hypothetical protein